MTSLTRVVTICVAALLLVVAAGCGGDTKSNNDYVSALNKGTDRVRRQRLQGQLGTGRGSRSRRGGEVHLHGPGDGHRQGDRRPEGRPGPRRGEVPAQRAHLRDGRVQGPGPDRSGLPRFEGPEDAAGGSVEV